eukprot:scaffold1726_cov260-Pinguiococcus_pyrenoidosus.AAC.32
MKTAPGMARELLLLFVFVSLRMREAFAPGKGSGEISGCEGEDRALQAASSKMAFGSIQGALSAYEAIIARRPHCTGMSQ